jgi:ribosome-associated protein|tara:strand:- start:253 stop:582 length:330 start_codon:yes stop_codon:yes gene_type:complete
MVELIKSSLNDDKGEDIVVIDLSGKSSIADYMIIVSGRSSRQVAAMSEHLRVRLKAAGFREMVAEGERQGDWVLLDCGDVIVHLFRPEVREFYNLEKMWNQARPEAAQA